MIDEQVAPSHAKFIEKDGVKIGLGSGKDGFLFVRNEVTLQSGESYEYRYAFIERGGMNDISFPFSFFFV
jgi:hypothetical protein